MHESGCLRTLSDVPYRVLAGAMPSAASQGRAPAVQGQVGYVVGGIERSLIDS